MKAVVRGLVLVAGVALVAWTAYHFGRSSARRGAGEQAPAAESQPVAPAWARHGSPLGYSLEIPLAWTVDSDPRSGLITIGGAASIEMKLWHVWIDGPFEAADGGAVIQDLAGRMFPGVEWKSVDTAGGSSARLTGQKDGVRALALLTWTQSPNGTAALAATIAGAADQLAAHAADFARVIASFRATRPLKAALPELQFESYEDTARRAFTVEVPVRWKVSGGVGEGAEGADAAYIETTAPDGSVVVKLTSGGGTRFLSPDPILLAAGAAEGESFSTPSGRRLLVRRYVPGAQFALDQVQSWTLVGFELKEMRSRPDLATALRAAARENGWRESPRLTAGEVAFTAIDSGRTACGFIAAVTDWVSSEPGATEWAATHVLSGLASPENAAAAMTVARRMLASFRVSESWWESVQERGVPPPDLGLKLNGIIAESLAGTYWETHEPPVVVEGAGDRVAISAVGRSGGDEQITVYGGSEYYWLDERGMIAGTDVAAVMPVDYAALLEVSDAAQ